MNTTSRRKRFGNNYYLTKADFQFPPRTWIPFWWPLPLIAKRESEMLMKQVLEDLKSDTIIRF